MKTEAQVKDIIRHLNGLIMSNKTAAIDDVYKGNYPELLEIIHNIKKFRYAVKLLNYILDDTCLLGEDY